MKDLIVVTGASSVQGTLNLYLQQLFDAKIDSHVEDLSHHTYFNSGGNLRIKVDWVRSMATKFIEYERIILSDGFDVTFYGTREDVLEKFPVEGVLWAGEKNCYPDLSIKPQIAQWTPWAFCNGGLLASTPQEFLAWADEVEKHPKFNPNMIDQQFHNMMLAEGSELCVVDDRTRLFFCLFGGYDELDFDHGLPVNTLCGTMPQFIHRNGKWSGEEMFRKYERSLQ